MATGRKGSTSKGGGVRFPDDDDPPGSPTRRDDPSTNDSLIAIPQPDDSFLVKAGFLRAQHRYEIIFTLLDTPTPGNDVFHLPPPSDASPRPSPASPSHRPSPASPSRRPSPSPASLRPSPPSPSHRPSPSSSSPASPSPRPASPRPSLRVLCVSPTSEGGVRVVCEYSPRQEGVLQEELTLGGGARREGSMARREGGVARREGGGAKRDPGLHVRLQARVMDRHHGTPMLLEGVRCLGTEKDFDSSDRGRI